MDSAPQWIVLAKVLRPQGRRGEVLADLFTDFPERFAEHPQVWLAPAGFAEQEDANVAARAEPRPATVQANWLPVGKNAGRIVLHFAAIDSIEQAEGLAGFEVLVPRSERLPLDPGAAYISDLTGCTVFDHGRSLGLVDDVLFPTAPDGLRRLEDAAPLLSVRSPEGDEILIPFATAFLRQLDVTSKSIHMELPAGLADINRPERPAAEE